MRRQSRSAPLLAAAIALSGATQPPADVRAVIDSGDGQTARAYAAYAAAAYQSDFSRPILVRIDGPTTPKNHPRHVVFTCLTNGCTFASAVQHELYDYVNRAKDDDGNEIANAYDARAHLGRIGLYVVLQAPFPAGTFRIRAMPVANPGERAVPTFFTLTTR